VTAVKPDTFNEITSYKWQQNKTE